MMGSASGTIRRWGASLSLVLIVTLGSARGDVTTERSSSILIFPKVLFDSSGFQTNGPVDTIIQISNVSNSLVFAKCFYVNAAPLDPTSPPGVFNPTQWQEVDFEISLTKQQPTHWLVSTGRRFDPTDNKPCKVDCSNAGFDPGGAGPGGLIPPVSDPFTGELKCIEIDSSGAPISGNHLKGEATLVTPDGDASKYNAIGVIGLTNSNDSNFTLCLGGGVSDRCPNGPEYNGCPQTVIVNHFADHASDPVINELGNGPSSVRTELTLVPCSEDFENQTPPAVTVQFLLTNEFEELFSTSTSVTCWGDFFLSDISPIFEASFLATRFAQTRMTPGGDEQSGFVGIAEEFHHQPRPVPGGLTSRAALNLHVEGARPLNDIILVPEPQ